MAAHGSSSSELEEELFTSLNSAGIANLALKKSMQTKRFETYVDKAITALKKSSSLGDPAASLSLERNCIDFEKDYFTRNAKDNERYDKQLSELAAAGKSLALTQDAEAYRQHVRDAYGPHREVKFPPTGESYRTVVDKQIKQLGRDKNGIVSDKLKEFYDARQASLRAGLNAYIELQCKALGLASPQKGKESQRGLER